MSNFATFESSSAARYSGLAADSMALEGWPRVWIKNCILGAFLAVTCLFMALSIYLVVSGQKPVQHQEPQENSYALGSFAAIDSPTEPAMQRT